MKNAENSITPNQLFFLLLQTQAGIGLTSLAYAVFTKAKEDSWIAVLLSGACVQVVLILYWALGRRFPSLTLYDYLPQLLGRFLGKGLGLLYICHFAVVGAYVLQVYSFTVSAWMLPLTPRWVILAVFVAVCLYLVMSNLRIMARFYVLVSCLLAIPLLQMISSYTLGILNVYYILPVGNAGLSGIMTGVKEASLYFLGFELLLVAYPYTTGSDKAKLKAASLANLVVTVFYTFVVFTVIIFFGPNELALIPEPVLYMLKGFTIRVVERLDLFFFSIWTVSIATTFASYLFLAAKGVQQVFQTNTFGKTVPYTAVACFVIGLLSGNTLAVAHYAQWVERLDLVFFGIVPVSLLIISYIFIRTETKGAGG
ncbi:GerAB/ArcD/ProY family transporter [Numidum massiliense]|uniref:GerAB/ArcD/ProY family transporter n=1 Tax=Numidum massiliense TaxID=1522315 RepID=UPI0006D5481A|nr:GerAB/ArcD/ProY family transporter [Numidum massiliense]